MYIEKRKDRTGQGGVYMECFRETYFSARQMHAAACLIKMGARGARSSSTSTVQYSTVQDDHTRAHRR